jgi:sarcosine oxidase subunit beta
MINLMPRLRNIRVRRTWRGLYPMTPDGSPIVGEVEAVQGYLNAVGMCGQGFMLGPGLAVYLRKLIMQEVDAETQEILYKLSLYREFAKAEKLK